MGDDEWDEYLDPDDDRPLPAALPPARAPAGPGPEPETPRARQPGPRPATRTPPGSAPTVARHRGPTRRPGSGPPVVDLKTFHIWNEEASSIPVPTQSALRTLEWVGRRENLCVVGPSGTGKSHRRGTRAGRRRRRDDRRVVHHRGPRRPVRRHRVDDSVSKAITRITRTDLIIVDEIGLLPVSPDAAEGFYRLVDAAYERRSLAVSSNLHPSGFNEIMPKTLATATVDRLLHHAHVVVTQGDSHRLTEATTGRGVVPLD
ncbi:ATP-binding protein [Kitasatospora sp. NPDC056651]|uniref:ATP-binding protein n=1 Tax=Kitasatospora sp. NPDC056651 TaxID=3345892 RepID=UPI0036C26D7A